MSPRATLFLCALLGVVLLAFHLSAKEQPAGNDDEGLFGRFKKPIEWQGRIAPDFEIEFVNGEAFKLSEQVGRRVIILNFFAAWCGPCKAEMPEINKYFDTHREEPFLLIGIDADESVETVKKFIDRYKVRFPVGIDRNGRIQKTYGVRSYPTTVFIGVDGRVQLYQIGQIANADIAFDSFLTIGLEQLRAKKGINKETYLAQLKEQEESKPEEASEKEKKEKSRLSARALAITEAMDCPCGCADRVADCSCKTAKNIRKKLEAEDLTGKTDEEVITALNKEFCVKGSKSKRDRG
ncbi:MAG: redoxin domain-containing protein [Nitrospirae bacterium]|nr:redoxin domain-containing protein [Nitrospirota bacterium]